MGTRNLAFDGKNYVATVLEECCFFDGCCGLFRKNNFFIRVQEQSLGQLLFKISEDLSITIEQFFKTPDGFCICGYIDYHQNVYVIKFDNQFRKIYLNDDVLKGFKPEYFFSINKIEILQVTFKNFVFKELENKKYLPKELNEIIEDYTMVENGGIRIYTDQNVFEYRV